MNSVVLMGRLTRDPEVRYSQGEKPVAYARYTCAVDRRFKREGQPEADFINCVTIGKDAEFVEKYFRECGFVFMVPFRREVILIGTDRKCTLQRCIQTM